MSRASNHTRGPTDVNQSSIYWRAHVCCRCERARVAYVIMLIDECAAGAGVYNWNYIRLRVCVRACVCQFLFVYVGANQWTDDNIIDTVCRLMLIGASLSGDQLNICCVCVNMSTASANRAQSRNVCWLVWAVLLLAIHPGIGSMWRQHVLLLHLWRPNGGIC